MDRATANLPIADRTAAFYAALGDGNLLRCIDNLYRATDAS